MISDDDLPWYGCLASQHYLGWTGFQRLIRGAGSARTVYALSEAGRREIYPEIQPKMSESLAQGPNFEAWEVVESECARLGLSIWVPGREGYPQVLLDLAASPPLLYARGAWRVEDARAVAMVGTRRPTDYGVDATRALTRGLCEAGYTIVSGLASGIDTVAHEAALSIPDARTLAVVGTGLDSVYPEENRGLHDRIVERGAVISEYPPGTGPLRLNFPRRNRILSALARATVVVEAGEGSGALHTANAARVQKKRVFAVPGSMFSSSSLGNQELLRAGALVAASADDIVAALDGVAQVTRKQPRLPPQSPVASRPGFKTRKSASSAPPSNTALPVPSCKPVVSTDPLLSLWQTEEACGLDALVARAVARNLWPIDRAGAALLEALLLLEMQGLVQRLPGPTYRRV